MSSGTENLDNLKKAYRSASACIKDLRHLCKHINPPFFPDSANQNFEITFAVDPNARNSSDPDYYKMTESQQVQFEEHYTPKVFNLIGNSIIDLWNHTCDLKKSLDAISPLLLVQQVSDHKNSIVVDLGLGAFSSAHHAVLGLVFEIINWIEIGEPEKDQRHEFQKWLWGILYINCYFEFERHVLNVVDLEKLSNVESLLAHEYELAIKTDELDSREQDTANSYVPYGCLENWRWDGLPVRLERLAKALEGKGEIKACTITELIHGNESPSGILNKYKKHPRWGKWVRTFIGYKSPYYWLKLPQKAESKAKKVRLNKVSIQFKKTSKIS